MKKKKETQEKREREEEIGYLDPLEIETTERFLRQIIKEREEEDKRKGQVKQKRKPTLLNKYTLKALEYACSLACPFDEACRFAGITLRTLYYWFDKYPKLKERLLRLQEQPSLKAREAVISTFHLRPDIAFKFLERMKPEQFGPKSILDGVNNFNLVIQDYSGKTKAISIQNESQEQDLYQDAQYSEYSEEDEELLDRENEKNDSST
jgi:hypothetical protein